MAVFDAKAQQSERDIMNLEKQLVQSVLVTLAVVLASLLKLLPEKDKDQEKNKGQQKTRGQEKNQGQQKTRGQEKSRDQEKNQGQEKSEGSNFLAEQFNNLINMVQQLFGLGQSNQSDQSAQVKDPGLGDLHRELVKLDINDPSAYGQLKQITENFVLKSPLAQEVLAENPELRNQLADLSIKLPPDPLIEKAEMAKMSQELDDVLAQLDFGQTISEAGSNVNLSALPAEVVKAPGKVLEEGMAAIGESVSNVNLSALPSEAVKATGKVLEEGMAVVGEIGESVTNVSANLATLSSEVVKGTGKVVRDAMSLVLEL